MRSCSALVSISEKPMMALSGVRSSWLMTARNRLWAALPRFASARASIRACCWAFCFDTSRMIATTSRPAVCAVRAPRLIERLALHLDPGEAALFVAELRPADAEFDAAAPSRASMHSESAVRNAGRSPIWMRSNSPSPCNSPAAMPSSGVRIGRCKQHAAAVAMARDDVGHVAREQAPALFLCDERQGIGARDPLGAERNAGRIEQHRDDAERGEGAG